MQREVFIQNYVKVCEFIWQSKILTVDKQIKERKNHFLFLRKLSNDRASSTTTCDVFYPIRCHVRYPDLVICVVFEMNLLLFPYWLYIFVLLSERYFIWYSHFMYSSTCNSTGAFWFTFLRKYKAQNISLEWWQFFFYGWNSELPPFFYQRFL